MDSTLEEENRISVVTEEYRDELDRRIKDKIRCHETICEPELLDRIIEVYDELRMTLDDLQAQTAMTRKANAGAIANATCVHYKGQHESDYDDCTVVCDLHDDYVSRSACESCSDFATKQLC